MTVKRVVIVGGGIAGVSTAGALRGGGFSGHITLVDGGEVPYDRPPLSKDYLSGRSDLKQIMLQPGAWYDEQRIELLARSRAAALYPGEGVVELADGRCLPADRVVLANGGRPALPAPLCQGARTHTLRTAEDAERLRTALTPDARFLVVGGGLVGAEVASTARGLGCEVTLVEPATPPLASVVGEPIAEWLHGQHEAHGIATVAASVTGLDEHSTGVTAHCAGVEAPLTFDVALVALGMVPDTALAASAGLALARGILVDGHQVTSNPSIFAVGDAARSRGAAGGVRSEHWESARLDGERAASAILGLPAPTTATPWFWTDRHGAHVEVLGTLDGNGETVVRGELGRPPFAVFELRAGVVSAAVSVDDPLAVRAARRLIQRGTPVSATQLADPEVDLRRLLRG